MNHVSPGPGRPRKNGEILSEERAIKFAPSMMEALQAAHETTGVSIAEQVRRAVDKVLSGRYVDLATVGTDDAHLKFLTRAPAGPWEEALDHAGSYVINKGMADDLGVNSSTDVVVQVTGQSMEGAGIPDGAYLVMERLPEHRNPRRDQIALVQIVDKEGNYESTIKRWKGGDPAKLMDGNDQEFKIPEETVACRAVAVAKAIFSRL